MRPTNSALYNTGGALVNTDMYAADQTLTAGQTITTNSAAIPTNGADSVDLYLKATGGNASSAGAVTFYIARSWDGTNFESVGTAFVLTLATNTAVIANAVNLDTRNATQIKCIKIVNGDASYTLAAVNIRAFALQ
jgi:hypothetical protein